MRVLLGVRMGHRALWRWHEEKIGPWGLCCAPKDRQVTGVFEGAAAPRPPISNCFCSSGPEAGRGTVSGHRGVQASPGVHELGVPHPGGRVPAGGCASCSSAWRGLGDPQPPARRWGERIDPGVALGPPSQRHPRGLAAVPAVPCLRQRRRSPRSSHLPGASHPPPLRRETGGMLGILPAPEHPHPSAGASLPILPAIEPRLLGDGPPSSSSSARLPGAPRRGAGRRGQRARRWWRCHHLSTQEPEQGQKVGGWAAAPGGGRWCQAGIGVRTSAQGASLFPFRLHPSIHLPSPPQPPPLPSRSPSPSRCFPELQQLSAM